MSINSIISMVGILGLVMGGFIYFLTLAYLKEKRANKKRPPQ